MKVSIQDLNLPNFILTQKYKFQPGMVVHAYPSTSEAEIWELGAQAILGYMETLFQDKQIHAVCFF